MIILQGENVTKKYPNMEKPVLDGVNVVINKGDFVSILGASGSGKSTLLSILGGIERPDSGKVIFDGKNLFDYSEKELALLRRKKIGFVFQFFNLAPYLTVEENVILPMVLDGVSEKNYKDKLKFLLEYLKLEPLVKKLPSQISGGEQQRVAIARGLIFSPEIIFLDEPTGNLDSVSAKEIMELLKKVNQEFGTTILQVTHSEENAEYGNVIIRIKDGKILSN